MGESFLDFTEDNLNDAIEPKAVEEGEYTIRIIDWRTDKKGTVLQKDKNDNPYIMPILEVIECPEAKFAKNFSHFLRLPHTEMAEKDKNAARWELRNFFRCFEIDYSQRIDYEDCIGTSGEVLLIVSSDEGYGEQNKVKRFLSER